MHIGAGNANFQTRRGGWARRRRDDADGGGAGVVAVRDGVGGPEGLPAYEALVPIDGGDQLWSFFRHVSSGMVLFRERRIPLA